MVWGGCAAVVIRGKVVMEPLIAQARPQRIMSLSSHVPSGLPPCLETRQLLCVLHLLIMCSERPPPLSHSQRSHVISSHCSNVKATADVSVTAEALLHAVCRAAGR